jgi:hypothetical protein
MVLQYLWWWQGAYYDLSSVVSRRIDQYGIANDAVRHVPKCTKCGMVSHGVSIL